MAEKNDPSNLESRISQLENQRDIALIDALNHSWGVHSRGTAQDGCGKCGKLFGKVDSIVEDLKAGLSDLQQRRENQDSAVEKRLGDLFIS